jgi:molybdopterin/thiamine biosynthesis adenylyltransferase
LSTRDDAPVRYSRLARYDGMTQTLPRWQAATCAVVGLGGLGGGLAAQLARFGVARLILLDRDLVGPENLGHQSLFTLAHAGAAVPKAVAAAEVVAAINPHVSVDAHVSELTRHNIRELLDGATLLFDGLDNYYGRLLLNDYARSTGLPFFSAGVVRAVLPGLTGCLRCLLDTPPPAGSLPTCAAEGVFPPLLGVANALQFDAANRWLAGESTADDDALYSLRLPDWELRRLALHGPRADCPACHGRYEYLDGTLDGLAASACAPDRAELTLAHGLDLDALAAALRSAGGPWESLRRTRFCLIVAGTGTRYVLFPDGKVIQEGSSDPTELSRFVATYLGA